MEKRILVVDDETDIASILQFNLQSEGYAAETANSAEEALTLINSRVSQTGKAPFDLILLDVMMGEVSGFGMAGILKKNPITADIPIVFITALDSEENAVKGLDLGADDYITKPISMAEVKARVRAVLRRTVKPDTDHGTSGTEEHIIRYKTMLIDKDRKSISIDGKSVAITYLELEILIFLMNNKGRVFSRRELMENLWPHDTFVLERTVDVNITRLRKKITPYGECIKTRFGYGYYFEEV